MELRVLPNRLLVSEVFESVQGEGPTMGRPSTFLRLGLCNLACSWCDTKYTWDWKHYSMDKELRSVSLGEISQQIGAAKNLVITGGEPLLQAEALEALLKAVDCRVEVETAGTIAPGQLAGRVQQWNVSPKLGSSGNPLEKRRVDSVLETFASMPESIFKFVIADDGDLAELDEFVAELGLPAERVWLMPEATDSKVLAQRGGWLAPHCVERGFNLGTRLHVHLWGDRRGV